MLAWSTFYQMIGILLAAPVDAIPGFGNSKDFATIFTNQLDALKCFAQHQEASSLPSCPNCDCQGAWVYILLFVLFYTASSFFLVGVVKYGNATFFFIVNTFVIPLTEFAFGCPFLMGKYVESISLFNCMSLVILLVGIVIYRVFDPKLRKATTSTELGQPQRRLNVNDANETSLLHVAAMPSYQTFQSHLYLKRCGPTDDQKRNEPYYWTFP